MLTTDSRRVRTLRLMAQREEHVRRGATLVEDALRMATLPGLAGNRMVFVRSLDLGRIRSDESSASVALAVERSFRRMSSRVVHGSDPGAHQAAAVYFNDAIEPVLLLVHRLVTNQPTDAWFWPLAVPAWRRDELRPQALRHLLLDLLRTEAAPAAVIAMMSTLVQAGQLDAVLAALTSADGRLLLRVTAGMETVGPAVLHDDAVATVVLPARWKGALERWASQWAPDDHRLLWLAAVALADGHPEHMAGRATLTEARRLVTNVRAQNGSVQGQQAPLPTTAVPPKAQEAEILGYTSLLAASLAATPPAIPRDAEQIFAASLTASLPASSPDEIEQSSIKVSRPEESSTVAPLPSALGGIESADSLEPPPLAIRAEGLQTSDFAGLYYLLNILRRLGLPDWLQDHPEAAARDFCHRLLRRLADKAGAQADDAIFLPLKPPSDEPEDDDVRPMPFVVPQSWLEGIIEPRPLVLHSIDKRAPRRALCEPADGLAVAVWYGPAPPAVHRMAGRTSVRRGETRIAAPDFGLALESWTAAVVRWCRRYTGMEMETLVCRAGRLLVTRTHLDVYFTFSQVDIRIRGAGLDINPGWLLWLGRVVSYWYLDDRDEVFDDAS